jgi:hypothetical protein
MLLNFNPYASKKDVHATGGAFSPPKRTSSNSDQNQSGSGSETLRQPYRYLAWKVRLSPSELKIKSDTGMLIKCGLKHTVQYISFSVSDIGTNTFGGDLRTTENGSRKSYNTKMRDSERTSRLEVGAYGILPSALITPILLIYIKFGGKFTLN